jgi:hypothetical protein
VLIYVHGQARYRFTPQEGGGLQVGKL